MMIKRKRGGDKKRKTALYRSDVVCDGCYENEIDDYNYEIGFIEAEINDRI